MPSVRLVSLETDTKGQPAEVILTSAANLCNGVLEITESIL